MATTGRHYHRLLAYYKKARGEFDLLDAAHEWAKYEQPEHERPIPVRPVELALFEQGDYHGFCRIAGLRCLPRCAACARKNGGK